MNNQISRPTLGYIVTISLAAVAVAGLLIQSAVTGISLVGFAMVVVLGAIAHSYPIQGFRNQAYQITLPFIVLAAATFNGIELVAFIVAIHVAEQIRLRRRLYIQWFNTCDYLLSAGLAMAFYHHGIALLPVGAVGELTAALAAACSFILVNRVLLGVALWLARGLTPMASGLFQPELLAADLVIAWIAGPMLVLAIEAGPWTVLVTAGPLLLVRPGLSALLRRQEPAAERLEMPAA